MHTNIAATVAWDSRRAQESEIDLIKAIAQRDKDAMGILFAQHRLRVYRYALRLLDDKEAAEDVAGEVFFQVWRHAGRFEGRSRVSTWLLAITRNLAFAGLRRTPMEELNAAKAAAIPDYADDPETAIQNKQHCAILAHCLTRLSLAHREAIDLVYYHGRSIDEVAAIMHVRPNTVKTRVFYARKQIAKLLGAFGMHRTLPTVQASASRRRAPRARTRAVQATVH